MTVQNNTIRSFEGAMIPHGRWRNFAGLQTEYNDRGNRNFTLFLPHEEAQNMLDEGWNIKWPKPNPEYDDPEEPPMGRLKVTVRFDGKVPPKVQLIQGSRATNITENNAQVLDFAEIINADVTIRAYCGEVNGKPFVTAYLKTLYATIPTEDFSEKYAHLEVRD